MLNIAKEKLASITKTHIDDWAEADGFDTGFGEDVYYFHPLHGKARVNIDSGVITIYLNEIEVGNEELVS